MENPNGLQALDDVMDGAIEARFNHAMLEVLENIADPNTEATKARKITLTVTIKPNDDRGFAAAVAEAKATLVPRKPVATYISLDIDGAKATITEQTRETPEQIDIDGNETTPRVAVFPGLRAGGKE